MPWGKGVEGMVLIKRNILPESKQRLVLLNMAILWSKLKSIHLILPHSVFRIFYFRFYIIIGI